MNRKGFTLIEILVVLVIISILASFTVLGVTMAIKTSKKSNSESMLRTIEGACESYQVRWGDYPPSTLAAFKVSLPNDTNNGVEALVACLSSQEKGGTIWTAPAEELYTNADDDEVSTNVTNWFFGNNKLREVCDYFGFTVTYLHHKDYKNPPTGSTKYILYSGADPQVIKAFQSGSTATFAKPMKFQTTCAGSDGKLGTDDDILPW